jgi:hypothetical protein
MFVWAGVSKLAQGKEWSIASTPFSTGRTFTDAAVKWALPWCEVVLGALLIAQVALVVTGVAACVLLASFTVRIIISRYMFQIKGNVANICNPLNF